MNKKHLENIARQLVSKGKGILAADESLPTIGKRFDNINLENNLMNREKYRRLLFTTPNLSNYISGVITFDETLRNTDLTNNLVKENILLGIKVDKGVKELYNSHGETVTQGLDDLDGRCQEYVSLGATFAKWRGVLKINANCPSNLSLNQNSESLARYAAICQHNGLVPIIEPEIVMDGSHDYNTTYTVSKQVISHVYYKMSEHHVHIPGTLLKISTVRPGVDNNDDVSNADIAKLTQLMMKQCVPETVPGVVFLSGGLSEDDATDILNELNKNKKQESTMLSFSYGRALQHSTLQAWQGKDENEEIAQEVFENMCKQNSLACLGQYFPKGSVKSSENLHVSNYLY
jgi:fructose-bisphosphate aldolase class I